MSEQLNLFGEEEPSSLNLPQVFEEQKTTTREILRLVKPITHRPTFDIVLDAAILFARLDSMLLDDRIQAINQIRLALHRKSPFRNEPVDCVQWVPSDEVTANDYNPNSVAPPEMKLLEHSIQEDGYTQPVVTWIDGEQREVIDGFHRNRVARESAIIKARVLGYLPVVTINDDREDKGDRIAATIRHNRARGKHRVDAMSEIVLELKRRNWSDDRVGKELGMDPDEVLRLSQITGLANMFADREFSQAWEHIREPAEEEQEIVLDDDGKPVDLEWMKPRKSEMHGWEDRTDKTSILWNHGHHLGMAQKSHFNDSWFWYAYTRPPQQGEAADKITAMAKVDTVTQ